MRLSSRALCALVLMGTAFALASAVTQVRYAIEQDRELLFIAWASYAVDQGCGSFLALLVCSACVQTRMRSETIGFILLTALQAW